MQKQNNNIVLRKNQSQVAIDADVIQSFKEIQRSGSFHVEQGGILAGYYDKWIDGIVISDITYPQDEDICGQFRFSRKSSGHQKIMDKLWETSEHTKSYIGEWHTHNQKNPEPSWIDVSNWKKIAKRKQNFDELFFVIVGTHNIGIWCVNHNRFVKIGTV